VKVHLCWPDDLSSIQRIKAITICQHISQRQKLYKKFDYYYYYYLIIISQRNRNDYRFQNQNHQKLVAYNDDVYSP